MLTVNNKDIRKTPSASLILNIFNIGVLNIEQLLHHIIVLTLLTLNRKFLVGTIDITNENSHNKFFFLCFNFAITTICVAIHLAEDGTRIGGI